MVNLNLLKPANHLFKGSRQRQFQTVASKSKAQMEASVLTVLVPAVQTEVAEKPS